MNATSNNSFAFSRQMSTWLFTATMVVLPLCSIEALNQPLRLVIMFTFVCGAALSLLESRWRGSALFIESLLMVAATHALTSAFYCRDCSVRAGLLDLQLVAFLGLGLIACAGFVLRRSDLQRILNGARGGMYVIVALSAAIPVLTALPVFVDAEGLPRWYGILGPSPTAVLLLGLAIPIWADALWTRRRGAVLLAIVAFGLILLTGTRIALVAALLSGSFLWLTLRRPRIGYVLLCAAALVVITYLLGAVLAERWFHEGAIEVNAFNLTGRDIIWSYLLSQVNDNLLIGQGLGAAQNSLILANLGEGLDRQPHNDYLKLLFNGGLVQLSIHVLVLTVLIRQGLVNIKVNSWISVPQRMSAAYAIALAILMITDNALVYHFFLYPMAIFCAIGVAARFEDDEMEVASIDLVRGPG